MVSVVLRLFLGILQGFPLIFLVNVCLAQDYGENVPNGIPYFSPFSTDPPATDHFAQPLPGVQEPHLYSQNPPRPYLLQSQTNPAVNPIWNYGTSSHPLPANNGFRPANVSNHYVPITPGFPNYDRWTQQVSSPSFWQVLPDGLIFPSYLAGPKESRLGSAWNYDKNHGWMWDATAGGRFPLLRYGTKDRVLPEGFQIDLEGAAMVRIDYEQELDLLAADFRVGVPITFGNKRTQYKIAYYHLSSHLGDEYMNRPDARERVNYVRDSLVFGVSYRIQRDVRLYGEAAWAFFTGEKTKPWEFQFGAEYSQLYPANRQYGSPFFAINGHLFQELNFGGNLNVQLGWQWRGPNHHLFRMGLQYFCGASDQHSFQDLYESKIGFGFWADF